MEKLIAGQKTRSKGKMNIEQVKAMSGEELNAKVGDLAGFKPDFLGYGPFDGSRGDTDPRHSTSQNYSQDLNAMHEAEKKLTNDQWVEYGLNLDRLNVFPIVHATARQRAEAFVLTMEQK